NCHILLALTVRDDIENQSAAFLAKPADSQGCRTIGVLTKPDTLQYGEFAPWMEVLEDRRHPLRHGYYMTRYPSPSELAEQLPYDAVRSLPKLRWDAASSRQSARTAAPILPANVIQTNPITDLPRLITTFSTDYQNCSNGTSNTYASPIQNFKPTFEKFNGRIASSASDFRPYTMKGGKECIDNMGGRKEEDTTHELLNPHEKDHPHRLQGSKRGNAHLGNHRKESHAVSRPNYMDTIFGKNGPMYVDQMKRYINPSLTGELHSNIPFSDRQGFIHREMASCEYDAVNWFRFISAAVASHMSGWWKSILEDSPTQG
ncbi:hypothetical protein FRC03_006110, partial [Tulasnella sp. 419]